MSSGALRQARRKSLKPGVGLWQDDSSPESAAQNVLAIALALLLAAAVGNLVWKVVIVSWALLSAAVRYVAVAFLLLAIAVFLA